MPSKPTSPPVPPRRSTFASITALTSLALLAACGSVEPSDPDAGPVDGAVPPVDAPPPPVDAPTGGPAALAVSVGEHDFGGVTVGGRSELLAVTVRNDGGEESGPIALALNGATPGAFDLVPTGDATDCSGKRLAGGSSCTAQVRFEPTAAGAVAARLDVSAVPGGGVSVALTGEGRRDAMLVTGQASPDFGDVVVGQSSSLLPIVIRNSGEQPSGALTVALAGTHAGDFQLVPAGTGDCAGAILTTQQTCTVQLRFRPSAAAARTAELMVSATPGGSVSVPLAGDGLTPGNLVVDLPAGGALDVGMRELGTGAGSAGSVVRVRNSGGSPTGALAVALTDASASYSIVSQTCGGAALAAGATCDVSIRFNPTSVGTIPATLTVRDPVAMTGVSVAASGVGTARIAVAKTGSGMIMSSPTGLSCGAGCTTVTGTFAQSPVSLTASEVGGWEFRGWTGACTSSNPAAVCSVPLTQALTSVGATFVQVFPLVVTTAGSGTVTSTPSGVLCGNGNADCSQSYDVGTAVQLTAEPDAGWEVFAWSGTGTTCAATARTCTVTMSQARNVNVQFRRRFTLTVSKTGQGVGLVTSTTGGISCGTTCSAGFWDGDAVTLGQMAGTDSAFVQWGGACSGAAGCMVTMTADRTVTAEFKRQYLLTLNVSGAGAGTITVQPGNFTCSSGTCSRLFDGGSTLTVTVAGASALDGVGAITGDCTATPCTLANLSAPRTVNASFVRYQCAPSTQTCTAGNFTQCDATGNHVSYQVPNGGAGGTAVTLVMNNYRCPMGCHATRPECADVNASNGFNQALAAPQTSPAGRDVVLPAAATTDGLVVIDTGSFDSATGETVITDGNGALVRVPAQVIPQTDGPEILVLKVRTFTIRSGKRVEVRGRRALGIASHFDVFIAGTIDLSADVPGRAQGDGAPGAWVGGAGASSCSGQLTAGGGGGGNHTFGGNGTGNAAAGLPLAADQLRGGCDGTQGGFSNGGGAIQLVSRTKVVLADGALVDVSGGAGFWFNFFGLAFTGGGAGGTVKIEAPEIQMAPAAVVAGRGGSGAAGNTSTNATRNGSEGTISGGPAAGVTCSGCGTSGAGGTESSSAGSATGTSPSAAGGGGSVGVCRTANGSGSFVPQGAMRIAHVHGTLGRLP